MSTQQFHFPIIILAMSLALGACTTPVRQDPLAVSPVEFGSHERPTVDRVYIVTDASKSMFGEGPTDPKVLTKNVIASLPDQQGHPYDVSWIAFGSKERVVVPLAPLNRAALEQRVAELKPLGGIFGWGGTTHTHRIFEELAEELRDKTGKTAVVLITDGETSHPARAFRRVESLDQEKQGQLCIHVIQVGNGEVGTVLNKALTDLNPCSSNRLASQLSTPADLALLSRDIFALETVALPDVAAAPPNACNTPIQISNILFAFDKASITNPEALDLELVGEQLKACPDQRLSVGGHTDSMGSEVYNESLSMRRARAVCDKLVELGVGRDRLDVKGFGMSHPTESNDLPGGRTQNRRVELVPY